MKALVTGGSRGIGRGIAMELAQAGYQVAIAHWQDGEEARNTASQAEAASGQPCPIIEVDLADEDGAPRTFAAALDGMKGLDVLVNNAGICEFCDTRQLSAEHINRATAVNFRAPLLLMQAASAHMVAHGISGRIVNITSSRGTRAYPGDAVYGGLKAALQRATESAALDLAPHGIRVNAVAPGATLVREASAHAEQLGRRIPLGRMGQPADIGKAVRWLVSDASAYATGIVLRIDGGLILPGMPESE
ncbi:SDR family oxidoreductase [Paenibacillus sp. IB182496]|uniref:SDR family oxidoreductase n=2 Tax=Paenibacillus sabuli TaxID=2772509 RepID=A0A927GQG4_9BACL|nr:SDR family oxidoreductase [Paenibacillus sabuli]